MSQNSEKKVLLASPRGFCAGVERSLACVEDGLKKHRPPIYVKHEIVHNKHVVSDLERRGVVFVETLSGLPPGALLVINAHGVPPEIEEEAMAKKLELIDATCPVVKKIHAKAAELSKSGWNIVIIGHSGHPEVVGIVGRIRKNACAVVSSLDDLDALEFSPGKPLAVITQTTLNVEDVADIIKEISARYPLLDAEKLGDVCYATRARQNAVRKIAAVSDAVIVIGSKNSSNSNRLREIASGICKGKVYLLDDESELPELELRDLRTIGLTAGASAPERLVVEMIGCLRRLGFQKCESLT